MAGSEQVIKNLYKWATMKRAGIEGESLTTAKNMTDYARKTARWQDRTGNARAGLNGGMFWETMAILKIFVAHSMDYGVYLELANDGKYAILSESINKVKDEWFNAVRKIMEQ
jgi:predicted peptidase